jgi:hypothetical protein
MVFHFMFGPATVLFQFGNRPGLVILQLWFGLATFLVWFGYSSCMGLGVWLDIVLIWSCYCRCLVLYRPGLVWLQSWFDSAIAT